MGKINVAIVKEPGAPTVTSVADTTSPATLAAARGPADDRRLGLSIENSSSAVLYILIGTGTVSSSNYSVSLAQRGYFELPKTDGGIVHQGIVQGVWASDPGDGAALITEYV